MMGRPMPVMVSLGRGRSAVGLVGRQPLPLCRWRILLLARRGSLTGGRGLRWLILLLPRRRRLTGTHVGWREQRGRTHAGVSGEHTSVFQTFDFEEEPAGRPGCHERTPFVRGLKGWRCCGLLTW
jgi:hypothetical protein